MLNKKALILFLAALPLTIILSGCSGGVNGEGTNQYSQTNGTTVVRGSSFNDSGWDLITKGQYESAITMFNKVLGDSPTDEEAAEANNGLGWAKSRLGKLEDGMLWFERAISHSHDAKVGLAGAYIQRSSKADLEMAADLLYKQLGGENPHFKYTPRRQTGVTDAECHAMLAYAFAAIGRAEEATEQLEYAKELQPEWASSTSDQIGRMVDFLMK
ncbi:MAG TPA: tetratricopeptide repeat protein [Candidatus Ozemobacteraceae bacterium]|nr:tetratricopeptide repeat protein [Candidatus Ozemobacteraceae bacterium]